MGPADVPLSYREQVVEMESGGNPRAVSRNSSAAGLHQFTADTWAKLRAQNPSLKLSPDGRLDPEQSDRAFRLFTSQNAALLARALGRSPDNSELYLAHFLGGQGATRVLTAPLSTPLTEVMAPAVLRGNRFLSPLQTVGGLRSWARSKVYGTARAPRHGTIAHSTTDTLNHLELNRIKEQDSEVAR